jgi:hypothetical protein
MNVSAVNVTYSLSLFGGDDSYHCSHINSRRGITDKISSKRFTVPQDCPYLLEHTVHLQKDNQAARTARYNRK